jgi:hypothetical protein
MIDELKSELNRIERTINLPGTSYTGTLGILSDFTYRVFKSKGLSFPEKLSLARMADAVGLLLDNRVSSEPEFLTREEFFRICERFDWTYAMSDDSRVYNLGENRRRWILKIIAINPEYRKIYDEWHSYISSTIHDKNSTVPRPIFRGADDVQ